VRFSRTRLRVEVDPLEWDHFFNTERPHQYLDDLTPVAVERLHYDRGKTLPPGRVGGAPHHRVTGKPGEVSV